MAPSAVSSATTASRSSASMAPIEVLRSVTSCFSFSARAMSWPHRRANLLGGGVAALLRSLRAGDGRAAGVVEREQTVQQRVGGGFIRLAAQQVGAKSLAGRRGSI